MFTCVLAIGKNGELGKNGDMPWGRKLTSDLKFVKELTMGKSLVMGSATFNSLPKLLPKRKHFIVTRNIDALDSKYDPYDPNMTIVSDLEQFLNANNYTEKEFIIFGGASIYKQAMPYCQKIYLTLVDSSFSHCDTFFDYSFNEDKYAKTVIAKEKENGLSYTRFLYERK